MTAEAVLVRHGEAVHEPGDPGLTAAGVEQAERVAAALLPARPVAVVSSPLRRTRSTALPLARAAGLPVVIDPRLRERLNWSVGLEQDRFLAAWTRSDRERTWSPAEVPDARSSATTARDLLEALTEHAVEDRVVVLATHGGTMIDVLRTLLGDDGLDRRAPELRRVGMPNASFTRLRSVGDGWQTVAIGDVRHLG